MCFPRRRDRVLPCSHPFEIYEQKDLLVELLVDLPISYKIILFD